MKKCSKCGVSGVRIEEHHIVPRLYGGTDHPSNLRLLCRKCHGKEESEVTVDIEMDVMKYARLLNLISLCKKKHLVASWAKKLEQSGVPANKVCVAMLKGLRDEGVDRKLFKHIYKILPDVYKREYNCRFTDI